MSIIKGDFILTLHVLAAKGYLSIQYLLSTPDFLKSFFLVGVMILYDISRYQEETMGLQKNNTQWCILSGSKINYASDPMMNEDESPDI